MVFRLDVGQQEADEAEDIPTGFLTPRIRRVRVKWPSSQRARSTSVVGMAGTYPSMLDEGLLARKGHLFDKAGAHLIPNQKSV